MTIRRIFAPIAMLVLGLLALGPTGTTAAQDAAERSHPLVGGWQMTSDPTDPLGSFVVTTFDADGTLSNITADGTATLGVWAPTGGDTADVTVLATTNGPAYVVIRASVTVAADGQTLSGTYTSEYIFDPAGGGTSREIGPGSLSGTRLAVSAPGTPVDSFTAFFPQPDATPGATPES
jgi:hypothetical protein